MESLVSPFVRVAVAYKFSEEFADRVRTVVLSHGSEWEDGLNAVIAGMLHRLFVGDARYELPRQQWIEPDQEATIGKNWRRGYTLCDWSIETHLRGLRRKIGVFVETGNRELLLDICNYAMFLYMLDDGFSGPPLATGMLTYRSLPNLYRVYKEDRLSEVLVEIAATAVMEFDLPLHPKTHFLALDQGIHGTAASGAAID